MGVSLPTEDGFVMLYYNVTSCSTLDRFAIAVNDHEKDSETTTVWTGVRPGLVCPVEIRVIGEPAADVSEKRVKVERLFLRKREYILYPGRD